MGQPVVHFEVVGKDGGKLRSYYSELFDWEFNAVPGAGVADYETVDREANGGDIGISGGVGTGPEGYEGHVTFYVGVDDVEAALAKAESLGGTRMMGPEKPMEDLELGLFTDPEGHVIGLVNVSDQG